MGLEKYKGRQSWSAKNKEKRSSNVDGNGKTMIVLSYYDDKTFVKSIKRVCGSARAVIEEKNSRSRANVG